MMIWHNMTSINVINEWRNDCWSASVVDETLVTIQPSGFDLPRQLWSTLNQFQKQRAPCAVNLHKW